MGVFMNTIHVYLGQHIIEAVDELPLVNVAAHTMHGRTNRVHRSVTLTVQATCNVPFVLA